MTFNEILWRSLTLMGFKYYGGGVGGPRLGEKRQYLIRALPFGFGLAVKFSTKAVMEYERVARLINDRFVFHIEHKVVGRKNSHKFRFGTYAQLAHEIEEGR